MQYLGQEELLNNIKYIPSKVDDLISADSYNEEMIMNKYNSIDDIGRMLLLRCSIHISIIGSGNKTYGSIRNEKGEVVEIKDIFNKYNILYNKSQNEKYEKDLLSARRLVRLLRYHIQKFINDTNRPSYLWLKYSDKNIKFISICFPGAEHLVETKEDALYLILTYKNLDIILKTKFVERIKRVYIARGLYSPLEVEQL